MKNEDYTLFPIPTKLLDLMGIDTSAALRVAVDADGKLTVIKEAQQTELEDITIDDLQFGLRNRMRPLRILVSAL